MCKSNKIDICVIRRGYFPQDPRVNKEVKALLENGSNVDIIVLKKENQILIECSEKLNVYRIPIPYIKRSLLKYSFEYIYFFISAFILVNLLNIRKRYKYIQANSMPNFLVFVGIIPKLLGTKIILDVHEPMPELFSSLYKNTLSKIIFRILIIEEKLSFIFADKIITVSKPLKSLFISRNRFITSKIIVIHNAPYIKNKSRSFTKEKQNKAFIIISHGSILKRYGFKTLIDTVPYLNNIIPRYKIIIIGEGEILLDLIAYVEKNRWKNSVEFKGFLPQEDLFKSIKECDVGIVPIERDNFTQYILPNKLFEFVEIGVPVISSSLETIRMYFGDTISYFKSGEPEDLAKKIILLYKDYSMGTKYSERAKQIISIYAWDIEKEKYCNLFVP